ncbi:MAG: carboxypeptidase-like regulatory domain-containing protein [Euryarchaeota archaeon]|nr:carboxypeptidase-like regulatory domain-containing protein [Euryarchaeota archaeon]
MASRPTVSVGLSLILVALALSGCTDGDRPTPPAVPPECSETERCRIEGPNEPGKGRIVGAVKDLDFQPVEGANVTLKELAIVTRTDAEGLFAFNRLEPGLYTVLVAAPGHAADGRQVEVKADEETRVDVLLEALPETTAPYRTDIHQLTGFIGCTLATKGKTRGNTCGRVSEDPNYKSDFRVPMDAGLTAVGMALDAAAPPPGSTSDLVYRVWWTNPPNVIPPMIGKTGVDEVKMVPPGGWQESPRGTTEDTSPAVVNVELDNGEREAQFTYQHKFDLYLVFFHNGEPVPDGFSARPD